MPASENLTLFRELAAQNQWLALWPELVLACFALVVLVLEVSLPRERRSMIFGLGLIVQLGVLIGVVASAFSGGGQLLFGGLIITSPFGDVFRIFFLITSLLVTHLGMVFLRNRAGPRAEFLHIILVVTVALMLLAQSSHFLMFFVALETVTVGFYILVSYLRNSSLSLEAGLKYLILGALSSAIMLFGIVLLYGAAGNPGAARAAADPMQFGQLAEFINANASNPLVVAGALLVLCGVFFKIGAVPFQIWIPDVYQGAPTPTAAFLAIGSKAAGFAVLMNLFSRTGGPFAGMGIPLVPLLAAVATVTILYGALAPLRQRNVKRIMGLSGVSHAGYLLVGVVAMAEGVDWAAGAVIFYLFVYLLASFAIFEVMAHMAPAEDATQEREHYAELAQRSPFLAGVLSVGLGSLAGVPPLAGFIAKVLILIAIYQAGYFSLLVIALVGVIISIAYYFGWAREAVFSHLPAERPEKLFLEKHPLQVSTGARILMGSLAVLTVIAGFYHGLFGFVF